MKKQIRKHGTTTTVSRTLVDEYILQLSDLGVSLESLNLLGDLDLSEEDSKLTEKELLTKILEDENYKEQKELLEKYIAEFVKADLITQSVHRRSGEELVSSSNDNWVDGGVYLYRTPEKDKDGNAVALEYEDEDDDEKDDDDTTTTTTTTTTTVDTTTKSIDTASYGLTAEDVTVEMDDITHEYKIAWISDLQMMLPTSDKEKDDEWKGKWGKWVQSDITFDGEWLQERNSGQPYEVRMEAYNNSYQILEKIINCLEGNDFDAIVFGGDILDNYTDLNYDYLKEQLEKITNKNVIFLDGDHDYLTDMTTNYNNEEHHEVESLDGLGGKIKTITIGKDGDSITLVGQCDSNNAISNVSLKAIESYLNKTSNSLFFTHVPIESKTQSSSMQEWSKRVHNEQVYYWGTSSSCKYQADNTDTYLNTLYNSSSLKGVFAGHVHYSGNFEFNTGVTEHIFQASYNSSIGVITIKPTGNVSSTVEEPEQETEENNDTTTESGYYIKEVNSEAYVQMKYISYDEFQKKINNFDNLAKSTKANFRYKYTIDPDTGELLIAQLKTIVTKVTDTTDWLNAVFTSTDKQIILEDVKRIDYKSYIEKYTMPYEFLINLCQITQNPEFVYHVAMLARETNIMLVIQDDTTVEDVITTSTNRTQSFSHVGSSSMSGASVDTEDTRTYVTEVITTTMVPHLEVQQANTWSFYEEYEYTKSVDPTTTNTAPVTENPELPSELPNRHPASTDTELSYEGVEIPIENPEYWSGGPYVVERTYSVETTITITKYNPGILKNSTEKSKQFLGLLRNSTGKCNYDCYNNPSLAKKCAEEAEYNDSESATNVSYRIPNVTRTETPLNKLTSGEQMLYELLGQSLEGDSSVSADEDYNSQYKTRMQGIIDHMKYLLTFPQNEDVEVTGEAVKVEYVNNINVDDLIVKTDEQGALRPVTLEELVGIISAKYTGEMKTNAQSIANTLIECQDTYNVNAIFILAIAQNESKVGTDDTTWVKNNNWLSWDGITAKYSSPQENVETVMKDIATGKIYFTKGKITIKDIGYTYCPNTDDYPTQGDDWVVGVTATVKKMYSMIGIDITETNTDSTEQKSLTYYEVNGCQYPFYKQDSGSSWENNSFAGGTMKSKGCSITSIAIILNGYGQKDVTPETIRSEIGGQLTDLQTILKNHGIESEREDKKLTKSEIITHLQSGRPIIVHVKNIDSDFWTTSEHYMVLLDYRNNNGIQQVYVSNPGTVNSAKNGWVNLSLITSNIATRSILITSYPE